MFQDNNLNRFMIYENGTLIYSISSADNDGDYNGLLSQNRFDNSLYLFVSGKMSVKVFNAPYVFQKANAELKILIDSVTTWLSIGGNSTGPIKNNKNSGKSF